MITGTFNSTLIGIYALDTLKGKFKFPRIAGTLATKLAKNTLSFFGDNDYHFWWLDQICYRDETNSFPPNLGGGAFTTFGFGINIILFDSGINSQHADILNKVSELPSFVSSQGSNLSDVYGTGTHSAGLICGNKVGVARQSTVYSARVLDNQGTLNLTDLTNAITATINFYNSNSDKTLVLLNFFSIPSKESPQIPKQYNESADSIYKQVKRLLDAGIPVIAPAGDGIYSEQTLLGRVLVDIVNPAYIKDVFVVGAVTDKSLITDFSSYGKKVDIYAPGTSSIFSCSNLDNTRYMASKSATKSAASLATGVAALYLEKFFSVRPNPKHLFSRLKSEGTLTIVSNRLQCILTDPILNTSNPFYSIRINEIDNTGRKTLFPYTYTPVDKDILLYSYFVISNLQFISDSDLGNCFINFLLDNRIQASSITFAGNARALIFKKLSGPDFLDIDSRTGFLLGKVPNTYMEDDVITFVIEITDGITKKQKEFNLIVKICESKNVTGYIYTRIGKKNLISFVNLSNSTNNNLNLPIKESNEEGVELYKPVKTRIRFYRKTTGKLINEAVSDAGTGRYEVSLPLGEFFGIVDEDRFDLFRQNNRIISRIKVT